MAFLNSTTTICDAVLTRKGRELLSQGSSNFKITKFALADDEIDYGLWNPNHTSGSDYYGAVIEDTPVMEANTDEAIGLRYKLITLPKNAASIPYISVTPTVISITQNQEALIIPTTFNAQGGSSNAYYGYTAVLHNSNIAEIQTFQEAPNLQSVPTVPGNFSWTQYTNSQTAIGLKFKVIGKNTINVAATDRTTLITIYGNETGASTTIELTVTPPSTGSNQYK